MCPLANAANTFAICGIDEYTPDWKYKNIISLSLWNQLESEHENIAMQLD